MEFVLQFSFVILLVLLNGYFVAAEFALVAIRKTRVDELVKKGSKTAQLVQRAQKNIDLYISSTQLGITIASLALGWIGEPAVAHFLEPLLHFMPKQSYITPDSVAVTVGFILITFFHIVIGELAPKSLALQKAEPVAMVIIGPLFLFTSFLKPFIVVLNNTGNLIVSLFGLHKATKESGAHSEEEIKMLLSQSSQSGAIPSDEVEMVNNVFRLGEIPVRQIMIPRTDIVAFDKNTLLKQVAERIHASIHSRFPVYDGTIDNIVGFIHIKDLYRALIKKENLEIKLADSDIIRSTIHLPGTRKADDAMLDMRKRWIHLAVVTDEYGGTEGIVTLEDIIESLVGEIHDEFDIPVKNIVKQLDGSYLIDGSTPMDLIQRTFHLPIRGQGYATIGGFIFGLLGRMPRESDHIEIGDYVFEIRKLVNKRIRTIRMRKKAK